jgi:hypothetical protein
LLVANIPQVSQKFVLILYNNLPQYQLYFLIPNILCLLLNKLLIEKEILRRRQLISDNFFFSNIPKAEGLTAIEAWVIVCVLFVFGALIEYAGLLLKMKLEVSKSVKPKGPKCALKKMDDKRAMYITQCKKQREETSHARLDILFLLLFPIFFLCFNLIYWLSFMYYRPILDGDTECDNCTA